MKMGTPSRLVIVCFSIGASLLVLVVLMVQAQSSIRRVVPGGTFELHEQIHLVVAVPGGGPAVLGGNQVSNLLWKYEIIMPAGSKLENESVGVFSTSNGAVLHVDGVVKISPGIHIGRKNVILHLPGLAGFITPQGATVTLEPGPGKFAGRCIWLVHEFEVSGTRQTAKAPPNTHVGGHDQRSTKTTDRN